MDTEKITDFGLSGHPGNNRPDIGSWGGDKRERERGWAKGYKENRILIEERRKTGVVVDE